MCQSLVSGTFRLEEAIPQDDAIEDANLQVCPAPWKICRAKLSDLRAKLTGFCLVDFDGVASDMHIYVALSRAAKVPGWPPGVEAHSRACVEFIPPAQNWFVFN